MFYADALEEPRRASVGILGIAFVGLNPVRGISRANGLNTCGQLRVKKHGGCEDER